MEVMLRVWSSQSSCTCGLSALICSKPECGGSLLPPHARGTVSERRRGWRVIKPKRLGQDELLRIWERADTGYVRPPTRFRLLQKTTLQRNGVNTPLWATNRPGHSGFNDIYGLNQHLWTLIICP